MKINQAGIDLIKQFEGCKSTSYKDSVGVWTIGYGATGKDIVAGLTWTPEQIDERLHKDLARFEEGVQSLLSNPDVNNNQFSALVCFSYNLGLGNLQKSHLLEYTNSGHYIAGSLQFAKWNRAGGAVLPGLTKRREAEKVLYCS